MYNTPGMAFVAYIDRYNKTEHVVHGSPEMYQYTHLIVEAKSKFSPNIKPYLYTHEIMDTIEAFHQVSFNYFTIPPIKIKTRPVLFLLKRKEDYLDFRPDLPKFESVNLNQNFEREIEIEHKIPELSEKIHTLQNFLQENNTKHKVILEKLRQELHESYETSDYATDKSNMSKPDSLERIDNHRIESEVLDRVEEPKFNKRDISKWDLKTDRKNEKSKPSIKAILPDVDSDKIMNSKGVGKVKRDDTTVLITKEEIGIPNNIIRGKVRENIKNIIKQFKEEQILNTSEEKIPGTKDKIKNIIEKERKILEEEELQSLQKQILTIIENNPNIINKETIKEKLKNIILQDGHVGADIKKIAGDYKLKKPTKKQKPLKKDKVEIIMAKKSSFDSTTDEKTEPFLINPEKEFLELEINSASNDSTEEENALDLYDEHNDKLTEIPSDEHNMEYDENINIYSSLEIEFQAASEHLENIMLMIEEIVSNMEIEESYSEDSE